MHSTGDLPRCKHARDSSGSPPLGRAQQKADRLVTPASASIECERMRALTWFALLAAAALYGGCAGRDEASPPTLAPSPVVPTTPATPVSETVTASQGQVISNLAITTTSGPCIVVRGVGDVWIDRVQAGPCGEQGIYVLGAARVRITNSVIHTEHGDVSGFGTGNGILIQNSSDVLVQGNQVSNSSGSILAQASPRTKIIGNYSLNPLGPFPNASHFQLTTGSDHSEISDNFGEQRPRFRGAPDDRQYVEDGINTYQTSDVLIARNYLRDGDSETGCGIIAGDSFDGLPGNNITVVDNVLIRTAHCGVGVVGGTGHVVRGNRILDTNFEGDGGSSGIQVWDWRGHGTCADITVQENIVSNLLPEGYHNDYWDGSGRPDAFRCQNVDFSRNTLGTDARRLLTPEGARLPPPPIPPLKY